MKARLPLVHHLLCDHLFNFRAKICCWSSKFLPGQELEFSTTESNDNIIDVKETTLTSSHNIPDVTIFQEFEKNLAHRTILLIFIINWCEIFEIPEVWLWTIGSTVLIWCWSSHTLLRSASVVFRFLFFSLLCFDLSVLLKQIAPSRISILRKVKKRKRKMLLSLLTSTQRSAEVRALHHALSFFLYFGM